MYRSRQILASLVMLLFAVGSAGANEAYYMIVFACQSPDNQPRLAHTFAAFIKVADEAGKDSALETAVISWLPASGSVDLVRLRPEVGKNFGLKETLDWAAALQARVSAWGPFPIRKELYDSAARQVKRLESGTVAYKAVDLARNSGGVSNCIHAVCDLDIAKERLVTGTAHGEEASEMVARFLSTWVIPSTAVPAGLAERLGLTNNKITLRDLNGVRPGGSVLPGTSGGWRTLQQAKKHLNCPLQTG